MMRLAFLTTGIVLIGVLGFVIDAQSRIPVEHTQRSPRAYSIFASGRVEGATPEIELRFRLTGRVEKVYAEEGQIVQPGETLLQLDDSQYRHEQALAAAKLATAKGKLERLLNGARREERLEARALYQAKQAELEGAKLSWDRIRELRKANAVSQQEADAERTRVAALTAEVAAAKARLDLAEAPARPDDVAILQAEIEAAKASLDLARVPLERTTMRAPCRGQILQANAEAGELSGPDSNEPAVVLADTSSFRVRAFVEEMDAPRVRVG
ncbi:MAG: HlyD family secretion protein, partial [Planctomycetota bacterium]